jgi:hypothetical protein
MTDLENSLVKRIVCLTWAATAAFGAAAFFSLQSTVWDGFWIPADVLVLTGIWFMWSYLAEMNRYKRLQDIRMRLLLGKGVLDKGDLFVLAKSLGVHVK